MCDEQQMMKVKTIIANNVSDLDDRINNFITTNKTFNVINIKFQIHENAFRGGYVWCAHIMYIG